MEGPRRGNALSLVPIRPGVFPNVTLSPNLSFAATLYLTEKQEQARLASAGEDYEHRSVLPKLKPLLSPLLWVSLSRAVCPG